MLAGWLVDGIGIAIVVWKVQTRPGTTRGWEGGLSPAGLGDLTN